MENINKDLLTSDKEALLEIIEDLQSKLKKKNKELYLARTRLSTAKAKMLKMKDTVQFQRQRILELYH
jgi:hypothetical protein